MPKIIRVHDGSEVERRITLIVSEDNAPGAIEFLSMLPYGKEGPFIRAVVYQWLLERQGNEDLADLVQAVLSGPGGDIRSQGGKVKRKPGPKQKIRFNSNAPAQNEKVESTGPKISPSQKVSSPFKGGPAASLGTTSSQQPSESAQDSFRSTASSQKASQDAQVDESYGVGSRQSGANEDSNIMPSAGAQASSSSELSSEDLDTLDSLDRMF